MLPIELLERLADGRNRSRVELGESLAPGEDSIDAQLRELEAAGLTVVATNDGAVRLAEAIDWIGMDAIESAIAAGALAQIESIEHRLELESTNRYLLEQPPPATGNARVAIAEYQSAGRGRRGRSWSMPPGSGIALSVSWQFAKVPTHLSALSLAVGAAARRAILAVTGLQVGLKWPNDLIVDGGKVGGILVELSQLPDRACHVVAGIGINVKVPQAYLAAVSDFDGGARDIASQAKEWSIDRAKLAAALIERIVTLFAGFAASGFEPYRAEWLEAHVLEAKPIRLLSGSETTFGTVRGIGADGSLIVENENGERQSVITGDVTIRAQSVAGN